MQIADWKRLRLLGIENFFCVVGGWLFSLQLQPLTDQFLFVADKPVIDTSPELSKSASDGAGAGKLLCRAQGAPNVTFKWFREGREILGQRTTGAKYQIIDKNLDPLTWQSELSVRDVEMKDYGPYGCEATNIWGSSKHQVILVVTSKPDPPIGLKVLSTTYNSVILSWQPGFDGGFQQRFRIRWQKSKSEGYQFVEVNQPEPQYEVSPLDMDTVYTFNIMAFNKLGETLYSSGIVQAKTASKYGNILLGKHTAGFKIFQI